MFTFRFLALIFFIAPLTKMFQIKRNIHFQTSDDVLLSMLHENKKLPIYDINHWIQKLNLQHCVFVEIGEAFCALFVEIKAGKRENLRIIEYFLGVCDCETLRSWKLCSPQLLKIRKSECIFTEATASANTSARVHRRLCDIKVIASVAPICKCSLSLAGQKLFKTEGFPTCFLNSLPESICFPRGICGIAKCTVHTIMGIHSPQCDPNCHQKQPFCEEIGPWTSIAPKITSSWTSWSDPKCNVSCGRGTLVSKAFCEKNKIDCLGPGPSCCPESSELCECKVTIENGIMKVNRYTEPCTRSLSCPIVLKRKGFLLENQFGESENYGIVNNKEFDQERVEGNLYYDVDNYEIMKKDDEFDNKENNMQIAAIDGDIGDEEDDDSDLDNVSDNPETDEEELNEEEEKEENDKTLFTTTTEENDYESIYEDKSSATSVKFSILLLGLTQIIFINEVSIFM